jgi:hypothetical protein
MSIAQRPLERPRSARSETLSCVAHKWAKVKYLFCLTIDIPSLWD